MIFLIVGLGNPGKQYEKTRHNVGFMALDAFAQKNEFPGFQLDKKSNALISEGALNDKKILLAKPQAFMNNSGQAVKALYSKFYILYSNLIVVHDDIDLALGTIKISVNRGSAGHKGVDSIIKHLKTKNFTRIRIGIQPASLAGRPAGKPKELDAFVLKKFSSEELELLRPAIQQACLAMGTTNEH